jgi:hypothetical protein
MTYTEFMGLPLDEQRTLEMKFYAAYRQSRGRLSPFESAKAHVFKFADEYRNNGGYVPSNFEWKYS